MIRTLCMAFFALAVLSATPAAAQPVLGDTGIAELDTVFPNVQLGNYGVVVGLTLTEQDTTADPSRLLIYLPPFRGDSLCVTLVSEDGLYNGRFRFARYDETGWRTLILPTRHRALLRQHRTHRLAPHARLSPRCEDDDGVSLPTGWGAVPPTLRLSLLLNPQRVDQVSAGWRGSRRLLCSETGVPLALVFRFKCDIPAPSRPAGIREIRIHQDLFESPRVIDPISVKVWVPDGV